MLQAKFVRVAAILGALSASPLQAQPLRMSGAEIKSTFSGGAFDGVYADTSRWQETYNSDGSIVYSDRFGPRKGEWSVRGSNFCTFYTDGTGACWRVEQVSENCFRFYVTVGEDAARAASATGWATDRPGTCGPGRPVS